LLSWISALRGRDVSRPASSLVPFRYVPLAAPASLIVKPTPFQQMTACSRESVRSSGMQRSLSARPIVKRRALSANVCPSRYAIPALLNDQPVRRPRKKLVAPVLTSRAKRVRTIRAPGGEHDSILHTISGYRLISNNRHLPKRSGRRSTLVERALSLRRPFSFPSGSAWS